MKKASIAGLLIFSSVFGFTKTKSALPNNGYVLHGHLKNAANTEVYLLENSFYKNTHTLDSVATDSNGKFVFKDFIKEPGYYSLQVKNKNGSFFFILENAVISMTGDADKLGNIVITGSKENEVQTLANKLLMDTTLRNQYRDADNILNSALKQNDTLSIKTALKQKENVKTAYILKFNTFIRTYPFSLASVGVIDYLIHFDAIAQADSNLKRMEVSAIGNYQEILYFRKKVNLLLSLTIGKLAPEFEQTDTEGKKIRLSAFKGKYVLLDFWASWCMPCRDENPYLVTAYEKFHDKNFVIISISIDDNKNQWLSAVHQIKNSWFNVSDLAGANNAVALKYAVKSIPQNYLVNPDGKIIAVNLRGADLLPRLDQIIK